MEIRNNNQLTKCAVYFTIFTYNVKRLCCKLCVSRVYIPNQNVDRKNLLCFLKVSCNFIKHSSKFTFHIQDQSTFFFRIKRVFTAIYWVSTSFYCTLNCALKDMTTNNTENATFYFCYLIWWYKLHIISF